MQPQAGLIRAISAEFLRRKLNSFGLIGLVVAIVVAAILLRLVSVNAWWWLLAIPVFIAGIIGVASLFCAYLVVNTLRPELTGTQTAAVRNFVDKLERVAENVQTPLFIIMFRVVRDMVRPRGTSFVQTVATDSTTLHTDYRDLHRSFPDK